MTEQDMQDEIDRLRAANYTLWLENERLLKTMRSTSPSGFAARQHYLTVMLNSQRGFSYKKGWQDFRLSADSWRLDIREWRKEHPGVNISRDDNTHTYRVVGG